jgi:hypothetical protein
VSSTTTATTFVLSPTTTATNTVTA